MSIDVNEVGNGGKQVMLLTGQPKAFRVLGKVGKLFSLLSSQFNVLNELGKVGKVVIALLPHHKV